MVRKSSTKFCHGVDEIINAQPASDAVTSVHKRSVHGGWLLSLGVAVVGGQESWSPHSHVA